MDQYVGEIRAVAFNFAPKGWAFCDGRLLQIQQYTALFSLLGTRFGGDGKTTFGLPDYCGRIPVGAGTGQGLRGIQLGEKGGKQSLTLAPRNLPSHAHAGSALIAASTRSTQVNTLDNIKAEVTASDGATQLPAYAPVADATGHLSANSTQVTVLPAGGVSQPLSPLNPFLGTNFIISLAGAFPAR